MFLQKNIPIVKSDDGKIQVKVIAGNSMGKSAVIDTKTPIMYLHFKVKPGGQVIQEIPKNYNTFAYVANGDVLFGTTKKIVTKEQAVFFKNDGENVIFSVPSDSELSGEILLLAGVPLDEPVKRYGPFVMNTDQEIQQAISDYNNGKMGKIDF